MIISLEEFKRLNARFTAISKHLKNADIEVNHTYRLEPPHMLEVTMKLRNLSFESLSKMYYFCKKEDIYTLNLNCPALIKNDAFRSQLTMYASKCQTLKALCATTAKGSTTIRLLPKDTAACVIPKIIALDPFEATEGDYTYRFIVDYYESDVSRSELTLLSRNDDPIYDYLDKGYLLMELPAQVKNKASNKIQDKKFIVSNGYDINTAHIFAMCYVQPNLAEMLKNGCFINVNDAELLRLKLQRKLSIPNKKKYSEYCATIDADYQKNTTLVVVGKLKDGEIASTTVGNVTFSKTSARYEHVRIEATDLLDAVYSKINFNGEFDIYTVTQVYSDYIQTLADDKLRQDIQAFTINGIEISVKVKESGCSYINDIRVNRDEVSKAIYRASCHRTSDDYKLFLKSISLMSIKWHDIIANGLAVKINTNMTGAEYVLEEPSPTAPTLKLYIDREDNAYIKLRVDENRGVRVQLNRLIGKVETLNKKTNNKEYREKQEGYYYSTRIRRNAVWCAEQLVKVLLECCTFEKKAENGTDTVKEVLLTKEDVIKLLSIADEEKKAILAKSREFLDMAVKNTGAEKIEFMGKEAYKVKGAMREYAVIVATAKVYDYDTKQYRCIVNDMHYDGAGYDDVAARLLALKNDSVMQQSIRTLSGSAQPQYENAHNNYQPEREISSTVEDVVNKLMKE